MKLSLLKMNKTDELKIDGRLAKHYDVEYDFEQNHLIYNHKNKPRKISSYILNKNLVTAVNAAIVTGRPLLLKGEPGCGKSKLAQAVANYFFQEEAYKYYFEWHIKSRSKARDGAYTFDHIGRMRDASVAATDLQAKDRVSNVDGYINLGALGNVIKSGMQDGKKPILLIDEIDKGDIDFPNDLLLELDEMRFKINEKKDYYVETEEKDYRPLVFITSNNERELPPAFLRRCIYYYIPAFDNTLLVKIAQSKMKDFYDELNLDGEPSFKEDEIVNFIRNYQTARDNASGSKPPSTSEMLDWLKLLTYHAANDNRTLEDLAKDSDLRDMALKLTA